MTTGTSNTAIGTEALQFNTSANYNTAIGVQSLRTNTTGANNTAVGANIDSGNFSGSLLLGKDAIATGNNQAVFGSALTNAGAVAPTGDLPCQFLWNVKINGTDYNLMIAN
jgi:trimeric autotransporter adhesin